MGPPILESKASLHVDDLAESKAQLLNVLSLFPAFFDMKTPRFFEYNKHNTGCEIQVKGGGQLTFYFKHNEHDGDRCRIYNGYEGEPFRFSTSYQMSVLVPTAVSRLRAFRSLALSS